jgi:pantoate--beta-alanine ligase
MELIRAAHDLRGVTDARRAAGDTVGLVPTLGALHEGHASLIRRARDEREFVVVSIFLNPLQFGPDEDLASYPRDEAHDLAFCEGLGVDAVWAPSLEEMYPPGVDLPAPDPGPVGHVFEGAARPGHFAGVLKVVHRLFDVTGPCAAYFGRKDAQQLFLVRRMVARLDLPVQIVACPTVREPDGLACSSRNANLSEQDREQAGCLFLALSEAAALARAGERDARVLLAAMAREIGATPRARLDYVTVVDEADFQPIVEREPGRPALALTAVAFPGVHLIDNLMLPEPA